SAPALHDALPISVVCDIAGASMDLNRTICNAADHFAAEELAAACLGADVLPGVPSGRGIEHHAAGRVGFCPAIGQHCLDQLKLGDRLSELPALHRIGQGVGNQALGYPHTDRRDVQATAIEELHGRLEAV